MAFTATESTSPYDVLSPIPDSTDTDPGVDTDVSADDSAVVDDQAEVTDDAEASEGSEQDQDSADASQEDDSSAEGGDPAEAAKQAADVEAAWKAKDGNIPPALKEIINANPQHAKKLKEMFFTNQRNMKFGGHAELRKMKDTVDAIGGPEKALDLKNQIDMLGGEAGFQEAITDLSDYRAFDELWRNSDPAVVEQLAQSNPASFEALAPVFFGKLGDINPDLYNNIGAKLISMTFGQDGTSMNLMMMQQALAGGNTQLAKQYLDKVITRIQGLEQMANQAPAKRAANPQQQEWQKEKEGYEQQLNQQFVTDLTNANVAWMDPKIDSELNAYLGAAFSKLPAATKGRVVKAVKDEIWNNHLQINQQFSKQREALIGKRDKDALVRLYKQYSPDKLWSQTVRNICEEFALKPAAKRAGAAAAPKTSGQPQQQQKADTGFQRVNKYPKPEEVDNSRTTFDMKVKDQFILKDGRRVQFVRQ